MPFGKRAALGERAAIGDGVAGVFGGEGRGEAEGGGRGANGECERECLHLKCDVDVCMLFRWGYMGMTYGHETYDGISTGKTKNIGTTDDLLRGGAVSVEVPRRCRRSFFYFVVSGREFGGDAR